MANDIFKLAGSYSTQPASGVPSADPQVVSTGIDESLELAKKQLGEYTPTTDAPVVVDMGGLVNGANVMLVKVIGGKVKLLVTSSDGSAQAIPCDDFLEWICRSVPITAVSIVRATGVADITVKIFLGMSA